MRGADLYMNIVGMTASRSLRQPPKPYVSVDMLNLIRLLPPETITIQGELIWKYLEVMGIPWGDAETLLYMEPQPGWTYLFDWDARKFIITDDIGLVTVRENIQSLSELGISWSILESDQFFIRAIGYFTGDAFLIAKRQDGRRQSQRGEYQWGQVDAYLNSVMHAAYGRLWLGAFPAAAGGEFTQEISGQTWFCDILLPSIISLAAAGMYPVNLQVGKQGKTGTRPIPTRSGQMQQIGSLVMIYLFASKTLNGSDPVIEPWLLWKLFQWFGQGTASQQEERIFDLSPWWG